MASMYKVEKEIFEKISLIARNAAKETAMEIAREIDKEYKSAIKAFYKDYSPTSYDRTFSLFTASPLYGNRRINRVVRQVDGGRAYLVNYEISGENIHGKPYVDYIISGNGYKSVTASNSKVLYTTFNVGMHGGMLPWNTYMPKKMTPTPKERMDTLFRKITSRGKVNKMLLKYISKYI